MHLLAVIIVGWVIRHSPEGTNGVRRLTRLRDRAVRLLPSQAAIRSVAMPEFRVRPARPGEAAELSELALRSKGYWGYDAAFLEACREELTLGPAEIGPRRVTVAADGAGRPVGFYTLDGDPPEGTLGMLFVDPDLIDSGVGRLLWEHLTGRAAALGFRSFRVEADPQAAGFYERMGATVIGAVPSESIPGRKLPLLVFNLPAS